MWDLLVRGGTLFDPLTGTERRGDIAVHQGRIAACGSDLTGAQAAQEVDATGKLVTPGLVDIHAHLWSGGGYWGVDLAGIAWRTGVTSWVDAGSAGAFAMSALRSAVAASPVSVYALLNVSAVGIPGETGENRDLENLRVDIGHAEGAAHGDFVRGVKARMDKRTVGDHGVEPLRRARELADRLSRPLMVHIGYGPPTVADVEPFLREGDILTHCASGSPTDLVTSAGISLALRKIAERGVHLDIGHGSGAFAFDVVEAERVAGLTPIISTDLHAVSAHGPAFDMPTVMEKMIAAGWSMADVFTAATSRPASALGLDAGTLDVGARADIAVFQVEEDEHQLVDVHGSSRAAPLRITNVATIAGGSLLPPVAPQPAPSWVQLSTRQRDVWDEQRAELASTSAPRLSEASDFVEPYPRDHTPTTQETSHA
jgi:dihydroorotase